MSAQSRCDTLALGGLLPLDDDTASRWPWAGAWTWPVGAECVFAEPDPAEEPAWRVLRTMSDGTGRAERHEGVDLGNGRARDTVRAVAHGLVVCCGKASDSRGYGIHVVLAHRLPEGGIVYSVYSHLQPGSVHVREGQPVWAHEALGEVGRSGRATTDHLHLEIRVAEDPGLRWERTRAVDPLAFIEQRLPSHAADTTWSGPYLDWAERAGLIEPEARASDRLARDTWLRMLARAARLARLDPPRDGPSLREALMDCAVLPPGKRPSLDGAPAWKEVERDLSQLARCGLRLPPCPVPAERHRATCLARLGSAEPARDRGLLSSRIPLTVATACVLMADLAVPAPIPPTPTDAPR